MGKGKKIKKYKAPDSKYLVVVNPWGTPGNPFFVNNVSAWFQLMMQDDYPGEDVKTVFTQGTHNEIIVELSGSIDILPYLGSHHYARFLKPPHNDSDRISHIYEYDYETQNDPTRRSWKANYPTDFDIAIFPIKYPYPLPTPAPPPPYHVTYAKRPKNVQPVVPLAEPWRETVPPETVDEFSTKRDPYEEADDAEQLLRTIIPPAVVRQEENYTRIKSEEPTFIKREPDTSVSLASPDAPSVKIEQDVLQDDYQPSADVLAAFSDLPPNTLLPVNGHSVKLEPVIQDDYEPSADLLAAFADLPPDTLLPVDEASDKLEPAIQQDNYEPSADLLAAFADFSQGISQQITAGRSEPPVSASFVKTEETDGALPTSSPTVRVKAEPVDFFGLPSLLLEQRDPRIRQRDRSTTLATNREESRQPPARIKTEPRDDNLFPRTRDPRLLKRGGYSKREHDDENEKDRTKRVKSECDTY